MMHSLSRIRILDATDTSVGSQYDILPAPLKDVFESQGTGEDPKDYVDPAVRRVLKVRLGTVILGFYFVLKLFCLIN